MLRVTAPALPLPAGPRDPGRASGRSTRQPSPWGGSARSALWAPAEPPQPCASWLTLGKSLGDC